MTLLTARDNIFRRVAVDHLIAGCSRVTWTLQDDFIDPFPYTYQLQFGESAVPTATDWQNVGSPETNVIFLLDINVVRDVAHTPTTHYRIKLTTPRGTYYSPPVSCEGRLNRRDWLTARAIARREWQRQKNHAAEAGWLFKRKKRTTKIDDPKVVDFVTGDIISTGHTVGVGTDRLGGYFDPSAFWISAQLSERYAHRDAERGMVNDDETIGHALAYPQLDHGDVWCTATGDIRYAVHRVRPVVYHRQVPIIIQVQLKKLSPTDPIYDLLIPTTPPIAFAEREGY